jgi:hypothetical protein
MTYVDVEVFDRESRFGGHLDLDPIFILEAAAPQYRLCRAGGVTDL